MITAAFLLFLAPATRVDLVDEIFEIPPSEWRYVDLSLKQEPVTVWCEFEVGRPVRPVRVAVMRRDDLERMRDDRPHGVLVSSRPTERGVLRHVVAGPGEYAVLVDNRAAGEGGPASVHLRIWLDFSGPAEPRVRYVSPRRRAAVVTLSLAVFGGIVVYSFRKLRRKEDDHRPPGT